MSLLNNKWPSNFGVKIGQFKSHFENTNKNVPENFVLFWYLYDYIDYIYQNDHWSYYI